MFKLHKFVAALFLSSLSLFATNTPQIQEKAQEKIQQEIEKEAAIEINLPKEIMVGYYGRPFAKSLGVLGHSTIDELIVKVRKKCEEFKVIDNNMKIVPTFHIIYGLATIEPGRDGDYIKNLSEDILMEYILAAQEANFAVIIDLQLGVLTPLEAVKPVLKFLKYDNVHLALDPEFKIPTHRRYPPGKYIGHIFGQDVNQVQEAMQTYMKENNIEGERKLFVHMFHKRMLRKKEAVKTYDNINLVYNIDGHGSAGAKVMIYNNLYKPEHAKVANSGYKIFYKTDKGALTTPRQMLGLDNVGSRRIAIPPVYINYH